ncbi:MAG: hypothetical protein KatS3mg068_0331 [Candidatus Sericytochromatia bacterium]|nr:MAG: hypothetical protein KatS3mg068_0331 [Candidatus Sericytochromatia bacterium]
MITIIYFIDDKYDEDILIQNPTLKYPGNLLLVCGNNYTPKRITNREFIKGESIFVKDYDEDIKKIIKNDFYLLLYPYESVNKFETENLEEKNYYIQIQEQYPKEKLELNKTNHFEVRLKNKNFVFTNINEFELYEGIIIYSYLRNFPSLQENKKRYFSKLYEQKKENSEVITFLIKNKSLKFTDDELIRLIRSEKINSKNRLELALYISMKFIEKFEYKKALDLLNVEYQYFGNSISLNYTLGLLHQKIEEYNKAIYFFKNVINLFKEKTFYKEESFAYSICTYYPNYYIGECYYNLKKYQEAKNYFEVCLNYNSSMYSAVDYLYEIEEILSNKNHEEELNFTCTMCGNSCRSFQVNITHDDIINILKNKPGLNINDFVELKLGVDTPIISNDIINWGKEKSKYVMLLKKKQGSNDCIFLENNLCSINDFKPLVCKVWPFNLREKDGKIRWGNSYREFIKTTCAYKLKDKTLSEKSNLKDDILKLNQSRNEYHSLVREWNNRSKNIEANKSILFNFFIPSNVEKIKKEITDRLINLLMINDNVIVLAENPFPAIYQTRKENNIFMAFFVKEKYLNLFKEKKSMIFAMNRFKSLFYYHINYPEENFKFYINSMFLYLYFLPYEKIYDNIYNDTTILGTKEILDNKRLSIDQLLKDRLKNLKINFEKLLFEANKYIKSMNYRKAMNIHRSIIDKELPALIYWLNKREFLPSEVQVLDITSKGLYKLFSYINSYELNHEGQSKLNTTIRKHFDNLLKQSKIISN